MTAVSHAQQASRLTVGKVLAENARTWSKRVAISFEGRDTTYGDLNERVNRLSNSLSRRGLRRGDRIAILSENRPEYAELIYAAAKLGLIVPALNWRLSNEELLDAVALTTPRAIVVSGAYREKLFALLEDAPFVEELVFLDDEPGASIEVDGGDVAGISYGALVEAGSGAEPDVDVDPEDGMLILYTSGTTGSPKGAVISHRAMLSRSALFTLEFGITAEETFIAWPPMFHMTSTDQMFATHAMGGKVAVVQRYEPEALIDILRRDHVSWLILMPGTISPFVEALKRSSGQIRGVRYVGAIPDLVPPAQIAELTSLLNAPYVNTYGSTETGIAPATSSTTSIPVGVSPKSFSKREVPFCEIRLLDEEDKEVPIGEPGELVFRGPTLCSGYWGRPSANEEDFRGGWFHTGDVLRRNADGTLDYMDRRKYLIKSGGENIYPAEIERVLMRSPTVQEAVAVRVPDEEWGEVPIAYVACSEPTDHEELLTLCREHLAGYKVPKGIRFVETEEFVRSTSGKIVRSEVERWADEHLAKEAT